MDHKFPLGGFHREKEATFSEIPFIPENVQWNEPKINKVVFHIYIPTGISGIFR